MDDIAATLSKLSLVHMVLGWAFVACYALSLGGMLEAKGSRRSAVVALLAAVLFCGFTDNWVHGALLVLFIVAGMGLFVAAAWLLTHSATWLADRHRQPPATPAAPVKPVIRTQPLSHMLRSLWRSQA